MAQRLTEVGYSITPTSVPCAVERYVLWYKRQTYN